MKILFLANRTPYPPYRGDKLKIYNLAKQLKERHEIHLLTFAQSEEDLAYEKELRQVFHKVQLINWPKHKSVMSALQGLWKQVPFQVLYFQSAAMRRAVQDSLAEEQYDAIHVQHLRMSPYLAHHSHRCHAILDLPDAFSLYWERRKAYTKSWIHRLFEPIEQRRLLQFEKRMIGRYPMALVCSREDQRYLEQTHHLDNLEVLPNGVDLNAFQQQQHNYALNRSLLFTGNMDYAPNVDAVQYFVKEIFPLILEALPQTHFIIAGQRPVKAVLALASKQVTITGFVKDLSVVYAQSSVVVAPLRFGAGTQNKVLEAMAMGVPVVCTEVGFEGLGVQQGEGVFKQTSARAFANQVIALLRDEDLRRHTGLQGQEALRSRLGWENVARQLEKYLQKVQQG